MITNRWFLGVEDISDAWMIRNKVFVEEQGNPAEAEHDDIDKTALHLVVYADGSAVGCARMAPCVDGFKLSRIAVLKEARGKRYGDLIMRLLLFKAFQMGAKTVSLDAKETAVDFYSRFGFVRNGEPICGACQCCLPMTVSAETVQYPSECHHE